MFDLLQEAEASAVSIDCIGDDKSKLLKVYQKLRMVHINLPSQKAEERRPCCVVSPQLVYRTVNIRYKRVTKMGRIFTKHRTT